MFIFDFKVNFRRDGSEHDLESSFDKKKAAAAGSSCCAEPSNQLYLSNLSPLPRIGWAYVTPFLEGRVGRSTLSSRLLRPSSALPSLYRERERLWRLWNVIYFRLECILPQSKLHSCKNVLFCFFRLPFSSFYNLCVYASSTAQPAVVSG